MSVAAVLVAAGSAWSAPPLSNATPALQELAARARDTTLPESERLDIVRALGAWSTPPVRETLVALLQDTSSSIREAAAIGLGWEGNGEAVAPLRQRLEAADEVVAVRAAALQSLGKIGDPSIHDTVVAASRDPEPRIRTAALAALLTGRFASPADRLPLLRRVAEDRGVDLLMRCEVIQELGNVKDSDAVPVLLRLLETEPPMRIAPPGDSSNQQEIMGIRFRQARDVRAWSASSLGQIENRQALPLLLRSAGDPDDFFLRLASMASLVAWKAREAVPVFTQRLTDPYPDVRALAIVGLAKAGDPSAADAALTRLADPVPTVRLQAVDTLKELRDPRARPELEALRKTELDSSVQQAIQAALTDLPR